MAFVSLVLLRFYILKLILNFVGFNVNIGFGSLLRSFGSQFYKSTNQDMCRDLTGRRLRDIKEEKRLQNYIEKAHVRKQEKQNKLESKYRKLLDPPKPDFDDAEYAQKKQKIMDETEHALEEGKKVCNRCGGSLWYTFTMESFLVSFS
ncbi:unnamed protein product [Soboliphyme baturini]|uniref:SDE2-like domain-containing protein n=1 Tax=Soboliphyme baturini TaxID=241478 RepID=A0A3P8AKF9_9BILA|nr:unnamed protein product [Soboliphyme baturini]